MHTPRDVLAKNFGVSESAFANLPIDVEHERYIFAGQVPEGSSLSGRGRARGGTRRGRRRRDRASRRRLVETMRLHFFDPESGRAIYDD